MTNNKKTTTNDNRQWQKTTNNDEGQTNKNKTQRTWITKGVHAWQIDFLLLLVKIIPAKARSPEASSEAKYSSKKGWSCRGPCWTRRGASSPSAWAAAPQRGPRGREEVEKNWRMELEVGRQPQGEGGNIAEAFWFNWDLWNWLSFARQPNLKKCTENRDVQDFGKAQRHFY